MSTRRIETLKPFAFQADFGAQPTPQAPRPDTVDVPIADLAAMGAQLQAEARDAARAPLDAAAAERLEAAIARLSGALDVLSELTQQLHGLGEAGALPDGAAHLARLAAQRICDGQGDLFAACQSFATKTGDTSNT